MDIVKDGAPNEQANMASGPPRPSTREVGQDEEILDQLASKHLVTRGSRRPLRPFEPIHIPGKPLSETLLEDRNDRF